MGTPPEGWNGSDSSYLYPKVRPSTTFVPLENCSDLILGCLGTLCDDITLQASCRGRTVLHTMRHYSECAASQRAGDENRICFLTV